MADAKSYVVQHTLVGVHRAGDVITFTEDHVKKVGVDVERLLRIGAIRKADEDEAKRARVYGDTNEELPTVFPPVPFDVTIPGSPDPQRSESPPTNPQQGIDPDPHPVGGTVSDQPKSAKK